MRQALRASWQDDLPEQPVPSATVLPFEIQRRVHPADQRSEVDEVLSALSRTAADIRDAQTRADQAEEAAREAAERLDMAERRSAEAEDQVGFLTERVRAMEASLRLSERKFLQISDWHAQQIAATEAELEQVRVAVEAKQDHLAELERAAAGQDAALRQIIDDAGGRIFAAETRALDATRDFEALRDYIRSNFGG